MSTESASLLVVDDDPDIIKAARLLLTRHGMEVLGAPDPAAAWAIIAERRVDVVLLDLNFARGRTSGVEGFAMLDRLIAADRDAVVVVVTGHSGIAVAVQAMRGGAADFVIKPWSNERLLATVERAVALCRARRAVTPHAFARKPLLMLGESAVIARVRDLIARIAPTDAGVLVRGSAGTGKTLVAALIHQGSMCSDRPLVEATGSWDAPEGATVLIEDVDTLDRDTQRRLSHLPDATRLIATSRQDRRTLGRLLIDDLLYRINTIEIDLPPLAERGDDALLLARHFLARFAARFAKPSRALSPEAERAILADRWPDNVRGLRRAMERAVLLGEGPVHDIDHLALSVTEEDPLPRAISASLDLAASEKAMVQAALKRHGFNVSRAAADLGLTRATLYRRMARHEL